EFEEEHDLGEFKSWSDRSLTLNFINLYQEFYPQFHSGRYKKKQVWDMIQKKIKSTIKPGNPVPTAVQCKYKWRAMSKAYNNVITNNRKKSGAARITCKYYEELNRILGTKPNVDPHDLVGNVDDDLNDYDDDVTVPEAEAIAEKSVVEQPKKKRKYTSSVQTSTQNLMS
uniref:Myb/SANT-like DNA-binding domain-containing protein n=1 Tax=Clytia hemisphaerica TaxID=252671 RepID=A0A7M5XLN4_9CNID